MMTISNITITQAEYNTVIDGLRQQLILHRRHTNTIVAQLKVAEQYVNTLQEENKKLKNLNTSLNILLKTDAKLSKKK